MNNFTYKGKVVGEIVDGLFSKIFVVYEGGKNYCGENRIEFKSKSLEEVKVYIDMTENHHIENARLICKRNF